MQKPDSRKELVNFFLKKGLLLSQDFLEQLESTKTFSDICKLVESKYFGNIVVLNEKIRKLSNHPTNSKLNRNEIEKFNTISERKDRLTSDKLLEPLIDEKKKLERIKGEQETGNHVEVVFSYKGEAKKRDAQDFINHFNLRYEALRNILRNRQELQNTISISRLLSKNDRDQVSVIGMVRDKRYTKNGNCMVTLEDNTGYIRIMINKTKPDLFKIAKDIVLDEVIGVLGVNGNDIVFVNNLIFPDVPIREGIKKSR